jgi:hypothetical protein
MLVEPCIVVETALDVGEGGLGFYYRWSWLHDEALREFFNSLIMKITIDTIALPC